MKKKNKNRGEYAKKNGTANRCAGAPFVAEHGIPKGANRPSCFPKGVAASMMVACAPT